VPLTINARIVLSLTRTERPALMYSILRVHIQERIVAVLSPLQALQTLPMQADSSARVDFAWSAFSIALRLARIQSGSEPVPRPEISNMLVLPSGPVVLLFLRVRSITALGHANDARTIREHRRTENDPSHPPPSEMDYGTKHFPISRIR
jgi:hypothetical protein